MQYTIGKYIVLDSKIHYELSTQKEYKDLAEQLSEYVVKLLDRVRTQEELELVMNKTGKATIDEYEDLARFKLALHYREKKVTHKFISIHTRKRVIISVYCRDPVRTRHVIRYRAIVTLRRPQIKQYITSKEGVTKPTGTSYNLY